MGRMSEPDIEVVIWTVMFGVMIIIMLLLFLMGYVKVSPNDQPQPKTARRLLFCCCLFYILSSFLAFSTLVTVLVYGWSDNGTSAFVFYVFALFYTISLFLMMYVWINRLETTFTNSMYQYSNSFMKFLKVIYWSIIIEGLLTLILFYLTEGSSNKDILQIIVITFAAIFTILFIGELSTLLIAFISKLISLRKMAESTLNRASEKGDHDLESMLVIQKLVKLQLKLTICAVISIISTLFAIPLSIIFDEHGGPVIYGIDSFIGFISIYCTIKTNQLFYEYFCILFIKCCNNYCMKTKTLDRKVKHHLEINSNTYLQSGSSQSPLKPSTLQLTNNPSNNTSANSSIEQTGHSSNKAASSTPAPTTPTPQ